jgi:predicted O-methyltransferase YrrM
VLRRFDPTRQRGIERFHKRAIDELEAALRATLFPTLPPADGRSDLLAELLGTSPSEAMYMLDELRRALAAAGEVCEFGVAQGATSALLANELRATPKQLWLFDSFQGLPAPTEKDVLIDDIFGLGAIERYEGPMRCGESEVWRRVASTGFPGERLHVVAGFIEQVTALPERIAFAYIDFDFYQPIATSLRIVDERMPSGGVIVVDDYGFFSAGAQTAVDEFLSAREAAYEVARPLPFAGHFIILRKR